jgi:hypothetical protein
MVPGAAFVPARGGYGADAHGRNDAARRG